MKRFPNGVDGPAFYQQRSQDREAAGRRAHRDAAGRASSRFPSRTRAASIGGIADHAALHDADRRDLAGPVVLARAVAARCRLRRARSRSGRRHAVRAGAGRGALGPRRAGVAEGAGRAEDLGVERAARLHPAAAGHLVRIGHAVLPDRRHGDRDPASEGRDGGAHGRARPRGTVYVDYPAEHPRQDARDRLQRAREPTSPASRRRSSWEELDEPIDPRDFTIETAPARFAAQPDLWARLRSARPASLEAVFRKYGTG